MKNFKKKYGDRIASVLFIATLPIIIYPFGYWIENPSVTAMQVAIKFWYISPIAAVFMFIAYYFDNSKDIHI